MMRVRLSAALCAMIAAGPVLSQEEAEAPADPAMTALPDVPALFDVSGVVPGDVLNIRTEPDASAERIGEFAADAVGVEVVEVDEATGWGRVNTGERTGWASLDFLTEAEPARLPDVARFTCFGTEPFWTLDLDAGGLSNFSTPEAEALYLTGPVRPGENRPGAFGVTGGAADSTLALAITSAQCSDGMSDRLFGLTAQLLLGGGGARTLSGCCSLQGAGE